MLYRCWMGFQRRNPLSPWGGTAFFSQEARGNSWIPIRQPNGRFLLEFGRPINPETSDERSWVRAFVMDFAQQYEAIVDQDPTQFLNFFDFWSTIA